MKEEFNVTFNNAQDMNVQFQEDVFICDFEGVMSSDYTGPYEVTPTGEQQILETAGKTLEANIVINPVPNYYGLIEWDGNVLTVR